MMQQIALSYSSAVTLRCTRNLWAQTQIEVQRLNNAGLNNFQVHQTLLAIYHESHSDRLHTAYLASHFCNQVSQGYNEKLCQKMRYPPSDSRESHSHCCQMTYLQLHHRIISVCIESGWERSGTGHLPIQYRMKTA
jgi:hypothetical protein